MTILADIFSTIDSAKRNAADFTQGLLADPAEALRAQYRNRENAAGENLGLLSNLYRNDAGGVTFDQDQWSAKARNSNKALIDQATGAIAGATVYHGSPHTFDKFNSAKINTGEGNQAFGNGLYFAQNKDVAKSYQNLTPAGSVDMNAPGMAVGRAAFDIGKGRPSMALEWLSDRERMTMGNAQFLTDGGAKDLADIAAARQRIKAGEFKPGNLYEVDLPDAKIAAMADWDKSLGKQPAAVKRAIERSRTMLPPNAMDDLGGELGVMYHPANGLDDFLGTANSLQPNLGENLLRQMGVPGIRYLDQGSRANGVRSNLRSQNYVVFPGEESSLNILSRNGKPLIGPGR